MGCERCKYDQRLEDAGFGYEALFVLQYAELDYISNELLKYVERDDFELKCNLLITVRKMLDIWQSIHLICENNKDYSSQIALSRVVIDNYSFLHLLFVHTTNIEEREARLLLYILDAITHRRKEVMSLTHNYPSNITLEEADKNKKQCSDSIIADNAAEKHILNKLSQLLDGAIDNTHIERQNWRFKDYRKPSTNKDRNAYSWYGIYEMFASSNNMKDTYSTYFSQFVHGLGVSNMQYGLIDGVDFTFNIAKSLIDLTKTIINKEFETEINNHNINFYNSDAGIKVGNFYAENITKLNNNKHE